jgi:hypothetical protein
LKNSRSFGFYPQQKTFIINTMRKYSLWSALLGVLLVFPVADLKADIVGEWDADDFTGTATWPGTADAVLREGAPVAGIDDDSFPGSRLHYVTFGPAETAFEVTAGANPIAGSMEFSASIVFRTTGTGANGENDFWRNQGLVGIELPGGGVGDWGVGIANGGSINGGSALHNGDSGSLGPVVNDGVWHVVTMVVDDLDNALHDRRIYLDGVEVATDLGLAYGGGNSQVASSSVFFGDHQPGDGGAQNFQGEIAHIRLDNSAMDAAAVSAAHAIFLGSLVDLGDSDGDGMPNVWEQLFGLDPLDESDGPLSLDLDQLSNLEEYNAGTDPTDPDSDDDGLNDDVEVAGGTDPNDNDSDDDGLSDGVETNTGIFVSATDTGSDPAEFDTDGDGASDGAEIIAGTDPNDDNSTPAVQLVQPSFPTLLDAPIGTEVEPNLNETGVTMQENHYNAGVLLHNNTNQNWDRVVVNPVNWPPTRTKTDVQPYFDHGPGGFITPGGGNLPYIDGGGDHFSIRVDGFVELDAGDYTIHLGADDASYFLIDTPDGPRQTGHNCCPDNHTMTFNISVKSLCPFSNLMVEEGGGDWGDLSISGPGFARVALGDVAGGSPPVYTIGLNAADSDNDLLPDWWENNYAGNLTALSGLADVDFDEDGLSDFDEFENGTDPTEEDTDADGLEDGVETNTGSFVSASDTGTDPTKADTDNDGLSDGAEIAGGTNPTQADSDGDGFSDSLEIDRGSDPVDSSSVPNTLVAHWHADDVAAGQVANWTDRVGLVVASGLGNSGPSKQEEGIFFDGLSASFEVAAADNPLGGRSAFTLTSVFKVTQGASRHDANNAATFWANSMLVGRELPGGNRGDYGLGINSENELIAGWGNPDGGTWHDLAALNDGEMHVASATFEVGVGISLYLDGQLVNSTNNDGIAMEQETVNFGVNILNVGNDTAYFTGHIQQILMHEVALPQAQVADFHARALLPDGPGLEITDVQFNQLGGAAGAGEFTLTWRSLPGRTYTVFQSPDLESWDVDIDDSVVSGGEMTTFSFDHPDPSLRWLYFRVEEQ